MATVKVFRDKLKEGRSDYFVEYQSADCRYPFAMLQVTFPSATPSPEKVRGIMAKELSTWVVRFPVPVMVSAFDEKEDLIHPWPDSRNALLMGYPEKENGRLIQHWGEDLKLPPELTAGEYLETVYRGVGFREQAAVREAVLKESRRKVRTVKWILGSVAVAKFVFELLTAIIGWLGSVFTFIGIVTGARKLARALGWAKPSKREEEEAAAERNRKHILWYCERDPEAFDRLKAQYVERECRDRTRKEAEALGIRVE